jgi:hypothetical protein
MGRTQYMLQLDTHSSSLGITAGAPPGRKRGAAAAQEAVYFACSMACEKEHRSAFHVKPYVIIAMKYSNRLLCATQQNCNSTGLQLKYNIPILPMLKGHTHQLMFLVTTLCMCFSAFGPAS